ncbi:hypothetical protein OHB26_19910 [Nocardia sp. NBC_01503]|uniref:hypothetical protein n=1 Tax=Nocardia sp. NBC_01503 TaxID=2975997 RepID=UPI002E7BDAA0|nr:hypothetical protein [Nocardia sp. NBC_01503]WTL29281.1 hypothetical protein OHB26_19910 [Nocardia sp. NBC_01503]
MRDAEGGNEAVGSGDGDLGDERLYECFGLGAGPIDDDVGDVVGDAVQRGGLRGDRFAVEGDGEFVAASSKLVCFGAQFAESYGEEFGV